MTQVLISEEHPVIRIGAQRQLQARLDIQVETCAKADLEQRLRELQPLLLILGVKNEREFREARRRYRELSRDTRFLLIHDGEDDQAGRWSEEPGIFRSALPDELPEKVRTNLLRRRPPRSRARPAHRAGLCC